MCRAHCAQTHIFVLANCAYARMCLKPGPGQVSTGRNLLKWSIWRCSTTRLCFWNISVPGSGHSFPGKANGAQLHHTPWEQGSRLTSGHQSVRPTTLQPGAAACTFPKFSFTSQWFLESLSSYRWHKTMHFHTFMQWHVLFLPNEAPNIRPFSKETKKMTIGVMPGSCSDSFMLFFIGFRLTKWCLISFQDVSGL